MSKLPPELRLIVSRKFGELEHWKLADLLKTLEEEEQARERSAAQNGQDGRRQQKEQSTGASLLTGAAATPKCCFCQQNHPSQECQSVTDLETRRSSLRKNGRCFVCLRRGHISRTCNSKIKCQKCKGRHHAAVYPENSSPAVDRPNQSVVPSLNLLRILLLPLLPPQLCGRTPATRCSCRQHKPWYTTQTFPQSLGALELSSIRAVKDPMTRRGRSSD